MRSQHEADVFEAVIKDSNYRMEGEYLIDKSSKIEFIDDQSKIHFGRK